MENIVAPNRPDHPNVKIPPPLVYVVGFVLGLCLGRAVPVSALPKTPSHFAAAVCLAVWAILGAWSIGLFRRAHTSFLPIRSATTLVISGPYRVTRNPMYVGLAFLYVGLALWFDVVWALVLLLLVLVAIQYYVILREEEYLERKFGDEYRQYKTRVRRWL
jgi:protein-S-isoprenylcysteine O-methyltransferase Ste14